MRNAGKAALRIEKMAPEGKGLARWEGRVVFVPHAAPGDRLEVALDKVKEAYALGRILRVLEPGPGRVEPACPLHHRLGMSAPACGGCDWQHLAVAEQRKAKRELVSDCLTRIGKLRDVTVEEPLSSPLEWRYRNKVQVPFGTQDGRIVAGFYAPGTHRIVDFPDCLVQPELSVRIVLKVKELARQLGWEVYDEDGGRGWLRHLYLRTNHAGAALVALVTRTPEFPKRERFLSELRASCPEVASVFQNVQSIKTSVVLGPTWQHVWGKNRMEEKLGPLALRFSPGAFLQVNTPATELLYGIVRDWLGEGGFRPELALDLYCGIGSIALWIAPACRRVLGVEENPSAIEDAWENARANGVRNARFLAGSVETSLGKIRRELEQAQAGTCAAVLDPPRAGCAETVLKSLRTPALRRVVYVSCNPATLARDAAWLVSYGYRLVKVQPVDLFPQTSHVETVALFDRTPTSA